MKPCIIRLTYTNGSHAFINANDIQRFDGHHEGGSWITFTGGGCIAVKEDPNAVFQVINVFMK